MTTISRRGVTVAVPTGWEVELTDSGGRVVLHMAFGGLPNARSDFGGHAIESLSPGRAFIAFLEYDPQEANTGLFKAQGLPSFVPSDFSPDRLQRYTPGQSGAQRFFTVSNRAFCCYVVLTREHPTTTDTARINKALAGVEVESFVYE